MRCVGDVCVDEEGADVCVQVFGGYLYFHKAPNKEEFQAELVRKLKMLHLYDCLRADKVCSMKCLILLGFPFLIF